MYPRRCGSCSLRQPGGTAAAVVVLAIGAQAMLAGAAWAGAWEAVSCPQVPGYRLNGVWGSGAGDIYAVGATGSVLHWNGSAWWLMTSSTGQELFSIWGSGAGDIWAVGAGGTIIHYDGAAWSGVSSPTTQRLTRVWGSGSADVWAVGEGSTVLHNNGSGWTNLNVSMAGDINGIWGSGPNNVYAVDGEGRILRYDGTGWSLAHRVWGSLLYGVWGTAADNIYAVGWDGTVGTIVHYDGTAWAAMASNTAGVLYDVWGSGPGDVYAIGTDHTGGGNSPVILHFDGAAWSGMAGPADVALQAVWGSGANDVYAVSYQGKILYNGTVRAMGSVGFGAASCTANRQNGVAMVTVTRTGGLLAGTTVDYATAGGTAVAGVDYDTRSGTLTFGQNETTKYILVNVGLGATTGSTFQVTLSNPGGGATLGAVQATTVTIIDGGTPPVLSVSYVGNSTEAMEFRVSLSDGVEWPVLADFATADGTAVAGADYAAVSGILVIPPWDRTGTIVVDLVSDANAAAGKFVTMTLGNVHGATLGNSRADGTIAGDPEGGFRCGNGVGAANMVGFYALCWVGLAGWRWRRGG